MPRRAPQTCQKNGPIRGATFVAAIMLMSITCAAAYTGTGRDQPNFRSLRAHSAASTKACTPNGLKTFLTAIADHARIKDNAATLDAITKVFAAQHGVDEEFKMLKLCGQAYHNPARLSAPAAQGQQSNQEILTDYLLKYSASLALPARVKTAIEGSTGTGAWPGAAPASADCTKAAKLVCLRYVCDKNFKYVVEGNPSYSGMDCPTV